MNSRSVLSLSAGLLSLLAASNSCYAQGVALATLTGTLLAPYSRAMSTVSLGLGQNQSVQLKCAAGTCADALKDAQVGDAITVHVDKPDVPTTINQVDSVARPVAACVRLVAFGASFILLIIVSALAVRWRPWKFLIGADNRYSNSQCQMVLWFGAVATMYLGILVLRVAALGWDYLGGIGITAHIAAITGLSALSFGGAKAITTAKIDSAAQAGLPPVKMPAARPSLRTDLFLNDKGNADFGDFQMILVTVAAVSIFVGQAFDAAGTLAIAHTISLPDVDSSLLAGFGIGQGAYLVKKAALKAGDG